MNCSAKKRLHSRKRMNVHFKIDRKSRWFEFIFYVLGIEMACWILWFACSPWFANTTLTVMNRMTMSISRMYGYTGATSIFPYSVAKNFASPTPYTEILPPPPQLTEEPIPNLEILPNGQAFRLPTALAAGDVVRYVLVWQIPALILLLWKFWIPKFRPRPYSYEKTDQ